MKMKRRPDWRPLKHQKINLADGSLYLERWVLDLFFISFRIHNFQRSDDDRALHDHPFSFVTMVLKGEYTDITDLNVRALDDKLTPGSIRFRHWTHKHTVRLTDELPCWTLVITGPVVHRWGFFTTNSLGEPRFVNSKRYFIENGHH